MRQLTIRNIPPEVAEALERAKGGSGASLNRTVIELLRDALLGARRSEKRNGLAALAGTWSDEEHERFVAAVAVTEQIDEDLWR